MLIENAISEIIIASVSILGHRLGSGTRVPGKLR